MEYLCGEYPVYFEDAPAGTLSVSTSGLFCVFDCRVVCASSSPLRLLCSSDGTPVSIGVLTPDGSAFVLRKRFSRSQLLELKLRAIEDCWCAPTDMPPNGASRTDASRFSHPWEPIADPAALFSDPDLRRSCAGVPGCLVCSEDDAVLLAVPADPSVPFPMMPIFCFGDSAQIGNKEYVVFRIAGGYLC